MRNAVLICIAIAPLIAAKTPQAQGVLLPCIDTVSIRQQFLDGEIEEVYSEWKNYLRASILTKTRIHRDCYATAAKMLGVLSLRLTGKKDTATAETYMAMVLKITPRGEMWDLWLPLETQTFWDTFREENGRSRTAEEIWDDRWIPPIAYSSTKDREALTLRKVYHRNRLLYANARDDAANYSKIISDIRDLEDPTFTLLRTDVMLRMGASISQTEFEMNKFEGGSSKVLSEGDLVGWRGRLGNLVKDRLVTMEKDSVREESNPIPSKLKIKPRPKN